MSQQLALEAAQSVASLIQMLQGEAGVLRSSSTDRKLHMSVPNAKDVGMQVYQSMAGAQAPQPAPAMAPSYPPPTHYPPQHAEFAHPTPAYPQQVFPTAIPQLPVETLAVQSAPQMQPDMVIAFLKVLDNIATTLTQIKVSLDTILNPTDENVGLHG